MAELRRVQKVQIPKEEVFYPGPTNEDCDNPSERIPLAGPRLASRKVSKSSPVINSK